MAGRGAGKSKVGALDVLLRAKAGEPWMAVSPTYVIMDDTTWPIFRETAEELDVWIKGVKSPVPRAKFRTQDGGVAELVFRSGDKPDSLRGPTKAGIWYDEASIMHPDAFAYGLPVLRYGGGDGTVSLTFTPKGKLHWTYGTFFERNDAGLYVPKEKTELIQAGTWENPFISDNYFDNMRGLYTSALAAQELGGEFIDIIGLLFRREWFRFCRVIPRAADRVRYWDKASTTFEEDSGAAFSCGLLMARTKDGRYYIEDVIRGQWTPGERNRIMLQTARQDAQRYNNQVQIYAEQEPGSGGKESMLLTIREMAGFPVHRDLVSGGRRIRISDKQKLPGEAKIIRAQPLAAQVEGGNVYILQSARWVQDYIEEMCAFPEYSLMDQVDASCLVGDTAVLCQRGNIAIRDVNSDDKVFTRSGWREVIAQIPQGTAETIDILLSDGRIITGTPDHRVWTDDGWCEINKTLGKHLHSVPWQNQKQSSLTALNSIDIQKAREGIYGHITTVTGEAKIYPSIAQSGFIPMGKFQRAGLSTISMAIPSTTNLKIWNCSYHKANMPLNIQGYTTPGKSILRELARWQPDGTDHPRGGHGIANTQKNKFANQRNIHANIVKQTSWQLVERNQNIVPIADEKALIESDILEKQTVPFVRRNLLEPAIQNKNIALNPVLVVAVRAARKRPVFDLQIDGCHEFFANGILVHNSGAFNKLAALYGAIASIPKRSSSPGADPAHHGIQHSRPPSGARNSGLFKKQ